MESGYEFDSLTELPPLPQVFDSSSESLPPFPSSDFVITPPFFSDHHHNHHVQDLLPLQDPDSFFLESTLSLLTRNHISENLFFSDEATPFLHVPDRKPSDTDVEKPPFLSLSPPVKKRRLLSTFKISQSPSSSSTSGSPAGTVDGGERRKKISDKIRSLEKLMPWEKQMSLATILEETHRYITFLQSQISALMWMPLESVYSTITTNTTGDVNETELLESLTRQQIMQVIANSAGARTELYSRGLCVFSYEQLLSLKMTTQSARNL